MKRIKYVDPPSGWLYGFPTILEEGKDYVELLKEHGYPEKNIPLALNYSRYWVENEDE